MHVVKKVFPIIIVVSFGNFHFFNCPPPLFTHIFVCLEDFDKLGKKLECIRYIAPHWNSMVVHQMYLLSDTCLLSHIYIFLMNLIGITNDILVHS